MTKKEVKEWNDNFDREFAEFEKLPKNVIKFLIDKNAIELGLPILDLPEYDDKTEAKH